MLNKRGQFTSFNPWFIAGLKRLKNITDEAVQGFYTNNVTGTHVGPHHDLLVDIKRLENIIV